MNTCEQWSTNLIVINLIKATILRPRKVKLIVWLKISKVFKSVKQHADCIFNKIIVFSGLKALEQIILVENTSASCLTITDY